MDLSFIDDNGEKPMESILLVLLLVTIITTAIGAGMYIHGIRKPDIKYKEFGQYILEFVVFGLISVVIGMFIYS